MFRYILLRIAVMVPTLLVISALIFTIIELPPGNYFETYIAELSAPESEARLNPSSAIDRLNPGSIFFGRNPGWR